jgi:hypothetical protein
VSETVPVLRGDPVTIRIADLQMDGVPWADWEDYLPVSQVRARERATVVAAEFTITADAGDMLLTLSAAATEALARPLYVWDVEFTDPITGDAFTWPGPGAARNRLAVTSDVTRVEVAP